MDIWEEIESLAVNFDACHKTLTAMGDETRQHIILEMMQMDYNGSRVIDIAATTNLSRPAVSHHLQILKDAGIVKMRKEGKMTFYYLDPDMAAFNHMIQYASSGNRDLCGAAKPKRRGTMRPEKQEVTGGNHDH